MARSLWPFGMVKGAWWADKKDFRSVREGLFCAGWRVLKIVIL